MLVTDTGVEWMTKNLPRKMDEIEVFMAQASKEMNYSRLKIETNPTLAVLNYDGKDFFDANYKWNSANNSIKGNTVRRGWTWTGKETALSALNHMNDSYVE
jgi:hypothetical protein